MPIVPPPPLFLLSLSERRQAPVQRGLRRLHVPLLEECTGDRTGALILILSLVLILIQHKD